MPRHRGLSWTLEALGYLFPLLHLWVTPQLIRNSVGRPAEELKFHCLALPQKFNWEDVLTSLAITRLLAAFCILSNFSYCPLTMAIRACLEKIQPCTLVSSSETSSGSESESPGSHCDSFWNSLCELKRGLTSPGLVSVEDRGEGRRSLPALAADDLRVSVK